MFSHITQLKYLPRWVVLFFDLVLCVVAFYTGYILSSKFYSEDFYNSHFLTFSQQFSLIIIFQVAFFWIFHTYSGVLRYTSFVDAAKLLAAVFFNVIIFSIVNGFVNLYLGYEIFFYSALLIYGVLSFLWMFFLRLFIKTTYDFLNQNNDQVIPVMIYGTQAAAIGIAKMLRLTEENKYKLVGFVDNDKNASEKVIMGVKVYQLKPGIIQKVIAKKAKAIIVSPNILEQLDLKSDLDMFLNQNMQILTSPPVSIWKNDMPSIKEIKSIQIEDLLDRPKIEICTDNIAQQLKEKVILITGAAGSIGSEIVRQVVQFKPTLIVLLDQAESPMHTLTLEFEEQFPEQHFSAFLGDIRNKERMDYLLDMYRPDIIYHAAAYKHVPLMEDNPVESVMVNVRGTKILADLAVKYHVHHFVMISTDKAVNPTNVMGASKRIAEIYVQSLFRKSELAAGLSDTKFITTRFGNVLVSNGSVIPRFKAQIEKGGPVTVTHPEIIRFFMTIPEACMLVLEAGAMGQGGEIFIFDMGNPVKIVTLAQKMIRLAGYIPEVDIKIEFIGLRPGEKLYEELLNKKELNLETHHPKIKIAKVQEYEFDVVSAQIDELIKYSFLCKNYLTVSMMKKIVPEFLSKNSQYERLDV
jgi:FlaA1/EpsC-like NDP-sugar epimerase